MDHPRCRLDCRRSGRDIARTKGVEPHVLLQCDRLQNPKAPWLTSNDKPFLTDIETLRKRARDHIDQGPVTEGYGADAKVVVKLLNEALATEIICTLRYRRHYFMAKGIHAEAVAPEFLEHATEEQQHADRIAERIVQLGGEPDFSPDGLATRSHSEYVEGGSLVEMIKEDLVAERVAIESYLEMIPISKVGIPLPAACSKRSWRRKKSMLMI